MRLHTSEGLLYPVTVTKLLRRPGDNIEQNAALFTYEYESIVAWYDEDKREDVETVKKFYSNYESEFEGSLTSLDVQQGQVLTRRTKVAEIEEACRHEIQFGGICANCGKDMTTLDYNSTAKDTERAKVNTVHGHTQLLVSQAEASKADEEAKRRLLDAKKLSLVVDLDQTIIHATVDPTVAEWQRDPSNPNYDAVKNVRAFQLVDDGPGARGCWYYIKLRPGLEDFLEKISKCYELHIYTMGTRAYAENIAKIIDPERKIFGERILSRDESGSMTAKNLKRLFPVDTKMVVIIDDRGDVWQWSPNLVKVSAYDFFVGIGDINSSFLPKRPGVDAKEAKPIKPTKSETSASSGSSEASSSDTAKNSATTGKSPKPASIEPSTNGDVSAVDRMVSMAGKQDEGSMREKGDQQDEQLAEQLEHRPLLQKQKILDAAEDEAKASPAVEAAVELLAENGEKEPTPENSIPKYRHNLLQDDDTELEYLGQSLRRIHKAYFDEYQKELAGVKGSRVAELRPGHSRKRSVEELENIPDAALIMVDTKAQVLKGVSLVFSGVVPLGVDIQAHDTAVWAKSFGAIVSEHITKRTTHVIASPERRTAKVRQAAKKGGKIAIVTQNWLFACFSQWRKVDENPFRVHSDAPANGASGLPDSFESKEDLMLSSSDSEAALTEDETELSTNTPNGVGALTSLDTNTEELSTILPTKTRQDSSPTEEESPDYWADINDEVNAFLDSDVDDDSEAESVKSENSIRLKTPPSARKRKRAEDEEEAAGEQEEEDSSSRLQKRKKEALARSSSLTQMANIPSSTGSTPAAVPEDPGGGGKGDDQQDAGEDEDDDDLEAMLAAEMSKESDEEEDRT